MRVPRECHTGPIGSNISLPPPTIMLPAGLTVVPAGAHMTTQLLAARMTTQLLAADIVSGSEVPGSCRCLNLEYQAVLVPQVRREEGCICPVGMMPPQTLPVPLPCTPVGMMPPQTLPVPLPLRRR